MNVRRYSDSRSSWAWKNYSLFLLWPSSRVQYYPDVVAALERHKNEAPARAVLDSHLSHQQVRQVEYATHSSAKIDIASVINTTLFRYGLRRCRKAENTYSTRVGGDARCIRRPHVISRMIEGTVVDSHPIEISPRDLYKETITYIYIRS